jgi:transmembrane sensor
MKEMKNRQRFTDKEWKELASILSDEKTEKEDLLDRYMAEDQNNSGKTWKDLKNMNNQEEIDVDRAWNSLNSRIIKNSHYLIGSPVRRSLIRTNLFRIAAAALLLLSVGTAAIFINNPGILSKKNTVFTLNDQKNVLISLPDGSKVYLNRNSKFTYGKIFGKHHRDVTLSGEAFFEIAPDASKPFIIDAGNAKVKVVGTSFNVITNNHESTVEVFVKTGKVTLSDNSESQSIQLEPGFVGTMNSKTSEKKVNSDPNYLSWRTNYLEYSGQKLSIVFKEIGRAHV